MTDATLLGAYLNSVNLSNADLTGATLTGADLWGADLTGARGFDNATLTGTILCNTTFPDGTVRNDDCPR